MTVSSGRFQKRDKMTAWLVTLQVINPERGKSVACEFYLDRYKKEGSSYSTQLFNLILLHSIHHANKPRAKSHLEIVLSPRYICGIVFFLFPIFYSSSFLLYLSAIGQEFFGKMNC